MTADTKRDRRIAKRIEAWFLDNARALPWRREPRDPYHSLVSEIMLQQTQVDRVIEKFNAFIERFPTVESLAAAPIDDVLAAWAGLGYYRRARHLHEAARAIVERHSGVTPSSVEQLRALPGVGRYTAGAIASIVFGLPEPIVDGNVRRVILRIDGEDLPPSDGATESYAWARAEFLVHAATAPDVFNEGLMELGAVVCTPRGPACPVCPVQAECRGFASGRQEEIPRPKPRARRRSLYCVSLVVRDDAGRILIRRRPDEGMWAGMWEAPTQESERDDVNPHDVAARWRLRPGPELGSFVHQTTHRDVHFRVHAAMGGGDADGVWASPDELDRYSLSNAQRRVLAAASVERT